MKFDNRSYLLSAAILVLLVVGVVIWTGGDTEDSTDQQESQGLVYESELERDAEDETLVRGDGYSMVVPVDWHILESIVYPRGANGMLIRSTVVNADPEVPLTESPVFLRIFDIEKGERSFDEVVTEFSTSKETLEEAVENIQANPDSPNAGITASDIYQSLTPGEFKGRDGYVLEWGCKKPCSGDGEAPAVRSQYIDDGEHAWILMATVGYSEEAEAALLEAKAITDTFELDSMLDSIE